MRRPRLIIAVLVASVLVAAGCSDDSGSTTAASSATTTPSAGDVATGPAVVEMPTPDGETLVATINAVRGSRTTVVLAHMRGANRGTWDPIIGDLTDAGYATLAFDFRGYGDSTGQRDTNLDVDLATAVDQARADGASKIVLIGASMGGTAVLDGGARLGVDGVVAISAPGRFLGLDGFAGATAIDAPVLLIDSEDDQPYVSDLTQIAADIDASLVTFAGTAHGTAIFSAHDAELTSEILDFIDPIARARKGY